MLQSDTSIRLEATTPPLPDGFPERYRLADLRNHPHVKRAVESGESVVMPDSRRATLTPEEQEIVTLRNLRSSLYVPIHLREKPLGILILSSVGEPHIFADEEVDLLHGFADQAARLIETTREYEAAIAQSSRMRD